MGRSESMDSIDLLLTFFLLLQLDFHSLVSNFLGLIGKFKKNCIGDRCFHLVNFIQLLVVFLVLFVRLGFLRLIHQIIDVIKSSGTRSHNHRRALCMRSHLKANRI